MNGWDRRGFLRLAAASASVGALAGCGSNGSSSTTPSAVPAGSDASGTISYGIWDANQEPAMRSIIQGFNKQFPKIRVDLTVNPWTEYWSKLQTQASSGTLPDVFWMNGPNFLLYAANGQLADLSALVSNHTIDLSNYPAGMRSLYTYQGKPYAIPKDFDTIALWYNKKIFKQAGLPEPTGGMSWEQLHETAKQISTKLKAQGVYGFGGGTATQELVYNLILQAGGQAISDDHKKSGYDSPAAKKALGLMAAMVADGSSPSVKTTTDTDPTKLFAAGKVAMVSTGSWMVAGFKSSMNVNDVQIVPLFKDVRPATVIHGAGNAVAASSKNMAAALAFAGYLGGKEAALIQARNGSAIPAFNGTQEVFVKSVPQWNIQTFLDEATKYSFPYPISKNTAAWNQLETQYIPQIASGQIPVDQGCTELAQKMNDILAKE